MSELAPDHDDLRRLLGGYLLGGLGEADTDRLDEHLRDCDQCRAELDRLAPVPELLRSLEHAPPVAAGARPSPARIEGLLVRMRADHAREHRRGRTRRLALVAAAVLLAGAGVGVVVTRDQGRPVPGAAPVAVPSASGTTSPVLTAVFEPADGNGLAGQAVLTGRTWGVAVDLTMEKLPGAGPFVCRVSNAEGTAEQAMVWGHTPSGRARVSGASSIQLGQVSVVAVTDHDGRVLGTAHLN